MKFASFSEHAISVASGERTRRNKVLRLVEVFLTPFLLSAYLLVTSQAAEAVDDNAPVTICNKTPYSVTFAFAADFVYEKETDYWPQDFGIVTEGWYTLKSDDCQDFGNLNHAWFYALPLPNGNRVTYAPSPEDAYGPDYGPNVSGQNYTLKLCIHPTDAFEIHHAEEECRKPHKDVLFHRIVIYDYRSGSSEVDLYP